METVGIIVTSQVHKRLMSLRACFFCRLFCENFVFLTWAGRSAETLRNEMPVKRQQL